MKLFTKDIDKRLFAQYLKGSDLDSQVAVAKIFNPYGNGRWFLLNSDPQDPDYLWAIVQMGNVVEVGSVLRSELESVRVSPFRLPLERDLGFTMVNAGELYRGLLQGKFYKKGGWVDGYARGGMTPGRWYKDNTGTELRFIGESGDKLLFNDGEKLVTKYESDFEEDVKEKKLFGFFENGGDTSEMKEDFLEDMQELHENIKEITLNDGSKITHQELMDAHKMDDGGFVEKTDEELKGMNDDELFEYLDAKAAYMKQYARPLSSFKAKNFAANATAVQFKNEGTSKLDANFPNLSKINQQATKDYEETIAKRNKMADGGMTENLKVGDIVVEYKKPNQNQPKREMGGQGKIILISNAMAKVEYENNYEEWIPLKDLKVVMASGGFTSSFSGTPDRRRVTKEKGGMVEIGSEGMYRGGAAKVLKYDDKNKMYAIKYLNKEGKVDGDFVMARKESFENSFADFDPKMANGGKIKSYQLGDMWSSDFDYDGMLKKGLEADSSWQISKLDKLSESFEDVNYHTENKPLYEAIQNLKDGNKTKAEENFKEFHKLLRKELGIKETTTTVKSEGSASVQDRLKNLFNKAKTATQQGYNKSKEYTKKQIHDQKKKVALSVIDETKVKASTNSEKNKLSDAKQIVSKKYAKGGITDKDYKEELVKYIYKNTLGKSVNGFKLNKKEYDLEGNFLWKNIEKPNLEIYATPFFTPDDDISYEEFVSDKLTIRQEQPYKLTGDLEKDQETYINFLEKKTKKYAAKMAMGGKVKFEDKVKAIKASLLKTKKVPKKVQKDYGKTYNAKEAEQAAKRIAGAMAKKGMK